MWFQEEEQKVEDFRRDYDKEPILIEDYNYIFGMMYLIVAAGMVLYFYFVNPFRAHGEISRGYFFNHAIFITIIPGLVFYFQIKKSKRQIELKSDEIVFKEEDRTIEKIEVENIESVKKTFNDYYMKNQNAGDIESLFIFLFLPFNLTIQLANKFFFHLFKGGLKSYRLFDSIILFDRSGKFINILPTTNREWEELGIYFKERVGIDLKEAPLFFKFNYGNEERNKK